MTSLADLRIVAKGLGIKGISAARKERLIHLIEKHQASDPVEVSVEIKVPTEPVEVKTEVKPVKTEPKPVKVPSSWHEFLKQYRVEHKCSLREAMSAKDKYADWKAKQ